MTIEVERTPATFGEMKDIDLIDPSPLNPRKTFRQDKLEELRDSIVSNGVVGPLIVRPGKKDRVEIVCGERRYRAAKMAALTALPCIVRYLTDVQVLTMMAIENEQRDDIHPLERAIGYQALMKADAAYTPERIGKGIGKSKRWVQLCLQYLTLIPLAQEYFRAGKITAGHVDLIVRLSAADQKKALEACFQVESRQTGFYELGENLKPERVLVSVRRLDEWITDNVRLPLDAQSPQLELLPPETREAIETAAAPNAPTLLELVNGYYLHNKLEPKPLLRDSWAFVKKGEKCPPQSQQRGVIVIGEGRGRVLTVCTGKGVCPIHWASTLPTPKAEKGASAAKHKRSPAEIKRDTEAADKKREVAARIKLWSKVRREAVQQARAIVAKLKPTSAPAMALLASTVREIAWMGKPLPKKPTFTDLLGAIVEHAAEDSDFVFTDQIAKPLGLDLKPLFAAAAPKKVDRHTAATAASHTKKPATKKRPKLGKGK